MNAKDDRIILGNKTRAELIRDYDTRNIQSFIGGFAWIVAIGLFIFFEIKGYREVGLITVLIGFAVGLIFNYLGTRCPICDYSKAHSYLEFRFFRFMKASYHCSNCRLEDDKIHEIFDLLIHNAEIDNQTIAQLTNRES